MEYKFCGNSGLQLPKISLGLWHNFGSVDDFENATAMILHAWENGVTHFDLANNYGPIPGSAETNFGRIFKEHLSSHRDEMLVSSKAGHDMWPGPYGDGSSRKNLIASCNQSLKRTGLEYFDIFYSHRYDGVTPVEETMQALIDIVHQGKALYVGISKYPPALQQKCYDILADAHVPCLISQYPYSMFNRQIETDTIRYLKSINLPNGNSAINCGRGGMVTDSITYSMWINYSTWGNPVSCTEGGGWNFETNPVQLAINIESIGYLHAVSSFQPTANEWHMLTGVYDRLNQKAYIYIDGQMTGETNASSPNLIHYNGHLQRLTRLVRFILSSL